MVSRIAATALPWAEDPHSRDRFSLILLTVLAVAVIVGGLIPLIHLPEPPREVLEEVPPQLAQVLVEQRELEPKPKPKPKPPPEVKEKPEPPPEPKAEAKPEPKPQAKPAPKQQTVEQAREVAESSGLLALKDDLQALRDAFDLPDTQAPLIAETLGKQASKTEQAVTQEKALERSGGIDTSGLSKQAGQIALAQRQTTELSGEGLALAEPAPAVASGELPRRSREDIRKVLVDNAASLYKLYNRARRKNPALEGQVLLELTIDPSGVVTSCRVLSSELNDEALVEKLARRVQLFKFPAKKVQTEVFTWPLDLVPS